MPSLQQKTSHTQPYETVLDLSRRRDSVETRKTPSPYQSSSFGDGSPSTLHDSPTTTTTASTSNELNRSETPVNHFPLPVVPLHQCSGTAISQSSRRSPPAYPSSIYLCQPKRENISPHAFGGTKNHQVECPDIMYDTFHRPRSSEMSNQDDHIRPYSIQAVALQKQHIAQVHLTTSEEESSEACSVNMMPQSNQYPMVVGRDGKLARPFKAYPRDPLTITASFTTASDTLMDNQSAEKYHSFRKRMLEQIHAANGGQPTISNPKMRRTSKMLDSGVTPATPYIMPDCSKQRLDDEFRNDTLNNNNNSDSGSGSIKDSAYFERRKKNNAAAKKSRDRRRIKEDEIAIRAAFLERENIELKFELASARKQLAMYGVTTSS